MVEEVGLARWIYGDADLLSQDTPNVRMKAGGADNTCARTLFSLAHRGFSVYETAFIRGRCLSVCILLCPMQVHPGPCVSLFGTGLGQLCVLQTPQ